MRSTQQGSTRLDAPLFGKGPHNGGVRDARLAVGQRQAALPPEGAHFLVTFCSTPALALVRCPVHLTDDTGTLLRCNQGLPEVAAWPW